MTSLIDCTCMYSYAKILKDGLPTLSMFCFGTLFFNLISWIKLCDKQNVTFVDGCDKILTDPRRQVLDFSRLKS